MPSAFTTFVEPEKIDAICLDMDGVLADLFGQKDWEERLRANEPGAYYEANPLVDMQFLNTLISLLQEQFSIPTYVISWGSMKVGNVDWYFDKQTEKVKKYWLERYLPAISMSNVFVVPYGTPKSDMVPPSCISPVLFDDSEHNLVDWRWDNTVHILPGQENDTLISTLVDLYNFDREYLGRTDAPML